jgi:site-specific DNA recombinase
METINSYSDDNLIMYLSDRGEPSPYGGGSPSSFVSKRRLMRNLVKIRISI